MGQDNEPKATSWAGRLGNWLRRVRARERSGTEHPPLDTGPSVAPLSEQELRSLKRFYLQRLAARVRSLYLYGLDARRSAQQRRGQALDLHAIYTPLNAVSRTLAQSTLKPGTLPSPAHQESASSAQPSPSALDLVGRHDRAIVRGSHGSGKSTLLRFLALSLAERSADGKCTGTSRLGPSWANGCPFPVWVDLQTLVGSPYNDGSASGLCQHIAKGWNLSVDQLREGLILPGGLIFLLDGLELAPNAVASFYQQFKETDNRFLLTSQVFVDLNSRSLRPLQELAEIELAPWSVEQMDQFVGRWYAELECKEWIDRETARDLPGKLRSALRRDEIRTLAQRPGLMILFALLHTMNGQLPSSQVACYDQLIDLILASWTEGRAATAGPPVDVSTGETMAEERDLRHAFDLEALQATIAQITYEKYARLAALPGRVELPTSELRAALINVGRDGRREAVDALIARMSTRPTLLDEPRPGIHVYAHPCLQNHAAAFHLANQPDVPQLAVSLAREDYARWREVILLAGARLAEVRNDLLAALELADALCHPPAPGARQEAKPDVEWRLAWLAGEILTYIAQEVETPRPLQTLACVEEWLTALVAGGRLTPSERTEAGRVLDRLPDGDTRPGVSLPSLLWCQVPAGEFWQGEEQQAQAVHVGQFWMSRYPVTNAQYAAFVRATGHPAPRHWQGEHPPPGIGNHPVVYATWQDAAQYCRWYSERLFSEPFLLWRLSRVEKLDRAPEGVSRDWMARLPTSQEWEKAARGGLRIPDFAGSGAATGETAPVTLVDNPLPRRTYPWGDGWRLSERGVRGDETRCNVSESNIGMTTPVGMYPDGSSPYGVLDMAGNVWEWCLNWADEQKRYKVRRGGAFRFTHEHARCAASDQAHPGLSWPHLGFRVVLGPPQQQEKRRWSAKP